jgi:hypothetical protein
MFLFLTPLGKTLKANLAPVEMLGFSSLRELQSMDMD